MEFSDNHRPVLPVNSQSDLFAQITDPQPCWTNGPLTYYRDFNFEIVGSDGQAFKINMTFSCHNNCTCLMTKMVADNKVFRADGMYRDESDISINITYDVGKVGIGTYLILWNDPSEVKKGLPPICKVGNVTIKRWFYCFI